MMRRVPSEWIPVYEPITGRLLFRYNPNRQLVEVQRRGNRHVFDLIRLADELMRDYHARVENTSPIDTDIQDAVE